MSSFIISPSLSGFPIAAINQVLGWAIAWILVPVCTFLLSDIFWKIYYPDTVFSQQGGNIAEQLAIRGQANNASTSWEWFKLREPPKPKPVQAARIKATLLGIVGVGEDGTAMIALEGKAPIIYRVGDEIQEGVFLSRLAGDHVILLRGDTEEKLAIKKADNLFSSNESPSSADAEQVPYKEETPIKAYATGSVGDIISQIKENPLKIGEMIEFETVDAGRYGQGIKIKPITTSEYDLLAKLNLNTDDIVVGIDRNRVTDIMADPASFAKILDTEEFKIQYMREGKLENAVVKMD